MKKKDGHAWYLRNRFLLGFILIFYGFQSVCQSFPKEREKFVKEASKVFIEEDMRYNVKDVFPVVITGNSLSEGNFNKMVDGVNALFESGYEARYAYLLVASYVYSSKNKFNAEFFNTWVGLEKTYRSKEVEVYAQFMEFSYPLFRYKALYKDDATQWRFKGSMAWNTEKRVRIVCTDGQLIGTSLEFQTQDSVFVSGTSGVFDFENQSFVGRNGTITWEKTGLNKNETFAELKGYKVKLDEVVLSADTVSLTTPYFQTPILGSLTDKTQDFLIENEGAPHFSSFDKRLKINNLREGLDYDGGFTLEGNKMVGAGVKVNPAKLIYRFENKPLIEIQSVLFTIEPSQILSREANLKLRYANGDSMVHQQGVFQYSEASNEITFSAKKNGSLVIPFLDYHYNISVNAPVLKWQVGSAFPMYTFEMATSQEQKLINVESLSFFDEGLYKKFGPIAKNPISQLAGYLRKNNSSFLNEGQASNALETTIAYAKTTLLDLASYGFIIYESQEKKITPTSKLFDYADAMTSGRDYDNFGFQLSLIERKSNYSAEEIQQNDYLKAIDRKNNVLNNRYKRQDFFAFIDVKKDQMFMTGVDEIPLSNAQRTIIYPDSGYCIMKPNRDLVFNGELYVGKFHAYLDDAYFSYEAFKVNVQQSSYASLLSNPIRPEDGNQPIELLSAFSNLKGEILIDEPTARSGRSKTNRAYPKLLVPSTIKVVYNDLSIVNGAYDSSRFYFKLEPFELDSLDNFHELSQRFKGELISGGIFPPISEPLKIMPDYSLGFSTTAPSGGWPFYGDKSKYENKVVLSNNGLQGSGTINYATATAISQKLTFLPDSTIGIAKFINKESKMGVKVPLVESDAAYIAFVPKKQVLKASSWKGQPLAMFNGQCDMDGTVILSVEGMTGLGVIHFPDADLGSKKFDFTHEDIHSDTSSFSLRNRFISEGQAPVAMETKDVKADVSFVTRKGEFNSFGTKRIKFPPNQYYCTMDKFFWYMDRADVDFEKTKSNQTTFEAGADLDESNFFSMLDEQDSLQFRSLLARYDLKLQTLFCNKVEYVRVGDAKIYPDSMKVIVRKNAVMDPFTNAKIVAPFIKKYHTFTNANVTVTSRKKYEGTASYPYYDRDSNLTVLKMKSIAYVNSVTQAEGEIEQKANFKLSNEFEYYGKVKVVAASQGLFCDGSTKINHACKSFDRSWMTFKDTILAKNIQIPISENPVNDAGKKLSVGFSWKNSEFIDSVLVYPAFLSKSEGINDQSVFKASGYVQYNPSSLTFQIGDKKRLNGDSDIGNFLTMYTETCSLTGIGKISFGVDLGEVTADSYGDISFNTDTKKIEMNVSTLLKFPMQKDVFTNISEGLKALESQKNVDLTSKKINFSQVLRSILPEEKVNDLLKDYEEDKLRKMPEGLDQTMVLSGLKFEYKQFKSTENESGFERGWVTKSTSVASEDGGEEVKGKNRCAIIAIEGKPVLKEVEFNMAIAQTALDKSNQGLLINFKNSADKDYLLNYGMDRKVGTLLINSNEPSLKTLITEMKLDKRKSKNFSFDLASDSATQKGLNRLKEFLRAR
jgi:hypothetical protein